MFTGVVKLAQIDDYISPSQNCIQPKIMKKDLVPSDLDEKMLLQQEYVQTTMQILVNLI